MFKGQAQAAMDLYVATLPDSRIMRIERYGQGEPGPADTVKVAVFTLCRQEFMCSDSPVKHDFTFTPSSSIFVEFSTEEELDRALTYWRMKAGFLCRWATMVLASGLVG